MNDTTSPALYSELFTGVRIWAVGAVLPTMIRCVAWPVLSPSLTVRVTLYAVHRSRSVDGWTS